VKIKLQVFPIPLVKLMVISIYYVPLLMALQPSAVPLLHVTGLFSFFVSVLEWL
jgi:hypothetical protein